VARAPFLLAVLGLLLATGCAPHPNTPPGPQATLSADAQAGEMLIQQKGCGGCHVIPGVPGAEGVIGPSLAGVASRTTLAGGAVPNNSPDDLKNWIEHPDTLKPGTSMPNLGLTDQQATQVVAYLELLT
jgi:cytochrome c1